MPCSMYGKTCPNAECGGVKFFYPECPFAAAKTLTVPAQSTQRKCPQCGCTLDDFMEDEEDGGDEAVF